MDNNVRIYSSELKKHAIAKTETIRLKDDNNKLVLVVPVESFAIAPLYQSVFKANEFPEAPYRMFLNMIKKLGGKIVTVVIDDLLESRFFANIYYLNSEGEEFSVTAEASDALAMAFLTPGSLIYVNKSIIELEKTDRINRVYWYEEDEELVNEARALSLDELDKLPPHDVKQLLEIAAANEDFEFAARLKSAREMQEDRVKQMTDMVNKAMKEDPLKFYNDFIESLKKRMPDAIIHTSFDDDDYDDDDDDDDDDEK
jgi:bifunctional DNase/RNase